MHVVRRCRPRSHTFRLFLFLQKMMIFVGICGEKVCGVRVYVWVMSGVPSFFQHVSLGRGSMGFSLRGAVADPNNGCIG
jgi:hypothetical protein